MTAMAAMVPKGYADPEALISRICEETDGSFTSYGFVTRIGSSAPLSAALREETLAYVRAIQSMLLGDLREYSAAGMPESDIALLQRAVNHTKGLIEVLVANSSYPNVFIVAELMMLTREVSDISYSLNNANGIAASAE